MKKGIRHVIASAQNSDVFVEAVLGDASDFFQRPLVHIGQEDGRFIILITLAFLRLTSWRQAAARILLGLRTPQIHFGWSDESPITANLSFILFGTGNIPWMVREIIGREKPRPECRPTVFVG